MITDTSFFNSEEGHRSLFNNAHDLIHFASPDGTLIYVNKTWINNLGYSSEEIQGKSFSEKIFHAFTRLNSKDQYEGTGLGLALCKNIVDRHQGFIVAEGEENIGATFKIILPQYGERNITN